MPGDKLPTLRKLSVQFEISVPTVKQAYIELERQGRVCARLQSGYVLTALQARTFKPRPAKWSHCAPTTVQCRSMIEQVHEAVHLPNTVALDISNPILVNPPDKTLVLPLALSFHPQGNMLITCVLVMVCSGLSK